MSITRLEKAYIAVLLVIFGGIVLHAPLSVGLGTLLPDYDLLIKSWKEILMLILIPTALAIVTRRDMLSELLRDWIVRLIIIYVAIHLVLVAVFFNTMTSTLAGLAIDLRYILFFLLAYVAIRALPQYRSLFVKVGTIGAAIVVGFATLQLFLPPDFLKILGYSNDTIAPYLTVDKNPDYIRVNGTLRGPNPLGAYAGIVLALVTAAVMKGKLHLQNKKHLIGAVVLTVCGSIALWISYSRSALVAGMVSVLIVLAIAVGWKLSRKDWIATGVVLIALLSIGFAARGSEFVSNVILHENPDGGSSISSNEGHVESLQTGIQRTLVQPFGAGVGSTGSASLHSDAPIIIENQYLFIAHETGWLGLAAFIGLFTLIVARLWRRRDDWLALGVFASGIGLALIGLLLPVWADDTVSIIWWGLAAVVLGGNHAKKTK